MRTHIISNGIVINTILATVHEAQSAFPSFTCVDASLGGKIGDLYDVATGTFSDPPPEPVQVPEVVTMRQARLALLSAGKLASVDTAINGLPSPQNEAARIEWDYATEVKRDWHLVLMLAPALGLDDAGLDALFVAAAGL
jgi:hypothetical protein